MRRVLCITMAMSVAACTTGPRSVEATAGPAPWDPPRVASTFEAARQAHAQGDLISAERLCRTAFEAVDDGVLAGYDAYVAQLNAERRADEATMRDRVRQLRAQREQRRTATQPTSSYLGFSPTQDLDGFADLLQSRAHPDEAQRMRSLAVAYGRVQQAHVQRTVLFHQGKDPRGTC